MVVKHNKTGNLYQLIDDECKSKINGKWVDAVIYQGRDKETGRIKFFVREKSDFVAHFTAVSMVNPDLDDIVMIHQIIVLQSIVYEYPSKTIENIIAQLEARRKEIGNRAAKQ